MSELKKVLMQRDELSSDEADDLIADMKQQVLDGENPDDVLYDIGLEPDYVFDLLD